MSVILHANEILLRVWVYWLDVGIWLGVVEVSLSHDIGYVCVLVQEHVAVALKENLTHPRQNPKRSLALKPTVTNQPQYTNQK